MGFDNKYFFWAYIYQGVTNIEEGEWVTEITLKSLIDNSREYSYVLGSGLDGYLKSFYLTNTIHDVFSFSQFKDTFNQTRYNCFKTDFNEEPFYINPGWGNGYVLPSDTSKKCDDLNIFVADGWDSNWELEPLFKCSNIGVAGTSYCSATWTNGKLTFLIL